jgi:hypothetical protein
MLGKLLEIVAVRTFHRLSHLQAFLLVLLIPTPITPAPKIMASRILHRVHILTALASAATSTVALGHMWDFRCRRPDVA